MPFGLSASAVAPNRGRHSSRPRYNRARFPWCVERLWLQTFETCRKLSLAPRLAGLRALYLYDCPKLHDLRFISALVDLRVLDVSRCSRLIDIRPLSVLVRLNMLHMNNCTELRDVRPLSALVSLHTLSLSMCNQLVDVRPLSALVGLHTLDRSGEFLSLLIVRKWAGQNSSHS